MSQRWRAMRRWWTRAVVGAALASGISLAHADITRPPGNQVELRGDASMLNFARQASEGYMGEHGDAVVTASGGGTYRGVKSVLLGTADIGLVTGEIPEELAKLAADRKIRLDRREVYRDAVVVLVHPKNPIDDLPLDRVRDVFRGAITNWKDLGGNDAPIVVVSHLPSTSMYETFKRRVLGDGAVITPSATFVSWEAFAPSMTENAIGYIGIHSVGRPEAGAHKAIKIGGISASTETLMSGQFPIQRELGVVFRADAPPKVTALVAFFLAPDKGQAIVRSLGDVPVK